MARPGSGAGSPIVVSGLTNGDSYTFTVTATNGVGTGSASAASTPVTPATVPDPPTDVTAAPDGIVDPGVLVVSFTPGFDEGSAIIAAGYTVSITDQTNPSDPNNGLTVSGSGSPITVSGLTGGDNYSFTVTATNGVGTGAPSSPSAATTAPPTITMTVPSTGGSGTRPPRRRPRSSCPGRRAAVTEPPVTEPPVTEPPVTEPPVTEPPVTEPPVTVPPVTELPPVGSQS